MVWKGQEDGRVERTIPDLANLACQTYGDGTKARVLDCLRTLLFRLQCCQGSLLAAQLNVCRERVYTQLGRTMLDERPTRLNMVRRQVAFLGTKGEG